jgi:hypothetical protein
MPPPFWHMVNVCQGLCYGFLAGLSALAKSGSRRISYGRIRAGSTITESSHTLPRDLDRHSCAHTAEARPPEAGFQLQHPILPTRGLVTWSLWPARVRFFALFALDTVRPPKEKRSQPLNDRFFVGRDRYPSFRQPLGILPCLLKSRPWQSPLPRRRKHIHATLSVPERVLLWFCSCSR